MNNIITHSFRISLDNITAALTAPAHHPNGGAFLSSAAPGGGPRCSRRRLPRHGRNRARCNGRAHDLRAGLGEFLLEGCRRRTFKFRPRQRARILLGFWESARSSTSGMTGRVRSIAPRKSSRGWNQRADRALSRAGHHHFHGRATCRERGRSNPNPAKPRA